MQRHSQQRSSFHPPYRKGRSPIKFLFTFLFAVTVPAIYQVFFCIQNEKDTVVSLNIADDAHLLSETKTTSDIIHLHTERQEKGTERMNHLFHMVLTTGGKGLSLVNIRSIESVFFHHPDATLYMHYNKNALPLENNTQLKLLHDAEGHDIVFLPYDPTEVLRQTMRLAQLAGHTKDVISLEGAQEFAGNIETKYKNEEYWYANEADLMRLCLIYSIGGTYMDTDMIWIKPVNDMNNIVGKDTPDQINNALLRFTSPQNLFIAKAINSFISEYNGQIWGHNGPQVLSRSARRHPELLCHDSDFPTNNKVHDKCYVTVLKKDAFYPVRWNRWKNLCMDPNTASLDENVAEKFIDSSCVHLNNKFTKSQIEDMGIVKGSVCDQLLSNYCRVCPQV